MRFHPLMTGFFSMCLAGFAITSSLLLLVEPVAAPGQSTPVVVLILTVVFGFLATLSQQVISSYNAHKTHEHDVLERKENAQLILDQTKAAADLLRAQTDFNAAQMRNILLSGQDSTAAHATDIKSMITETTSTAKETLKEVQQLTDGARNGS